VVAYPTESCFGLGCDPRDPAALRRILAIKGRAESKGMILVGGEWAHLAPYLGPLPLRARRWAERVWPGPVTLLMPPAADAPPWITGGHPRIAVRWTAHCGAAALCRAFGGAVVSTSANREGRPPLTRSGEVLADMGEEIDACLDGPVGEAAGPSAIRDALTGARLR
jgi:L-threonylcarbamoyladenylate synthase